MNKKLIRKMLTAAGGGLVYDDRKNIERTNYNNWSKLSFVDKMKRRFNIAKHLFNESSNPIINSVGAIFGEYDPENPDLNIGIVNAPGRATPQLVLLSAKLMETINNYWKNLGKLKIRLGGNGKYASGILTKPGTAPTTFNGLNISYITSPKGGNVTHKFYTDLGSEYILTKDGFARRIKAPHTNTQGIDTGLHDWNLGKTYFLDDKGDFSGQFRLIKEKVPNVAVATGKDGKMYFMNTDTNKLILNEEIFPTAVKKGILPKGYYNVPYSLEPKLGYSIFEFGTNGSTGKINWYHPGSSVAFIEGLKQGGKMNILEFLKNGNKIKKALLGTNLNIDTRSDTTRQGYNERGMSSVLSHNYFPLLDFYNAVEEISQTSNNPYLNTGIVYTPSRADRTWKFLHDFVKKNPRVLSNPTVVSKGMIPGNEITVGQVKQPLTGLTIRNNTPLTLENTVMNPAEKAAAEDYLASRNLKNFEEFPDVTINTKLPTGRPTGDYKYPKEIMEKYGFGKPKVTLQQLTTKPVSKTSSQRSKEYYSKKKEDKDNGVSRKRSRLVLNNKALTTGDMRSANTGRPRKAARNIDLEKELKKDNGYWGREFNKIKLKVALGKQGSELKYKDFLDSYWNYKLKGILGKEKFGGILNFYKNGSGIHIKEKNKGSFTRWCGGNVTEECIRRGKASSNPKIRKKATFADNARHFKHRLGGNVIKEFKSKRAFHLGVDISDSNPNAYKYVKKKYKMHLLGGVFNSYDNPNAFGGVYAEMMLGRKYDELLRELKKQKELLEALRKAQELELENLKTNSLLDMFSGIVQNKDWIVNLFNKNKKPSISMNGSSIITGKPDSSNLVITTGSGMNGTIDLWRKAIQG